MNINFTESKNGQKNAVYNQISFHSQYNPDAEAKRFSDNTVCSFNPQYIIITEPALSYCIPYLKEKYKDAKFICIRYCSNFADYNHYFDIVLNYFEHTVNFDEYLFNYFGEEKIFQILFLKWESSGKAFPQTDNIVWNSIRNCLQKAKTLLVTREYFEKKWLINSINFFKYSRNFVIPDKTNKPVLIIASGPSLKPLLPYINKIKNNFFIICLSSAISVLSKLNIEPDLYLSTDGGYWAGQHLKSLNKKTNIPLALPAEAFCPKNILQNIPILPLNYGDGLSADLFANTENISFPAERNGTVSGTALKLAMKLTNSDIFFTGLDLYSSKKSSHTEPNELEINSVLKDNKLTSKERRIIKSSMNISSLEIYQNWFASQNISSHKVYRIINENDSFNNLGNIQDISISSFLDKTSSYEILCDEDIFNAHCECKKQNLQQITDSILNDKHLIKQLFPLDYTSLLHNPDDILLKEKIENKKTGLQHKLNRLLHD